MHSQLKIHDLEEAIWKNPFSQRQFEVHNWCKVEQLRQIVPDYSI